MWATATLLDPTSLFCDNCFAPCQSCTGYNKDQCTVCKKGFFLSATTCINCDPACEECFGAGPNVCTYCINNYVLKDSSCISPKIDSTVFCGDRTYPNYLDRICSPCDISCF